MNGFDVTVAEYPGKKLVGIKVRTTMAKAKEDRGGPLVRTGNSGSLACLFSN